MGYQLGASISRAQLDCEAISHSQFFASLSETILIAHSHGFEISKFLAIEAHVQENFLNMRQNKGFLVCNSVSEALPEAEAVDFWRKRKRLSEAVDKIFRGNHENFIAKRLKLINYVNKTVSSDQIRLQECCNSDKMRKSTQN